MDLVTLMMDSLLEDLNNQVRFSPQLFVALYVVAKIDIDLRAYNQSIYNYSCSELKWQSDTSSPLSNELNLDMNREIQTYPQRSEQWQIKKHWWIY